MAKYTLRQAGQELQDLIDKIEPLDKDVENLKQDAKRIQGYVHNQLVAAKKWYVEHGLNKYPSITVVDSAGSVVVGEVKYLDMNNVIISFSAEFGGKAYIN